MNLEDTADLDLETSKHCSKIVRKVAKNSKTSQPRETKTLLAFSQTSTRSKTTSENYLPFRIPDTDADQAEASAQTSGGHRVQLTETPPGRSKQLQTPSTVDRPSSVTGCSGVLHDSNGKEKNLDSSTKMPYRHPNHAANKQDQIQILQIQDPQDDENDDVHPRGTSKGREGRPNTPEFRKNSLTVKPAKLNIAEFEGVDADSWIQNIEQYFDSARTPLDQRTEIDVSYLKGPVVQWWRGSGFHTSTFLETDFHCQCLHHPV